MLEKPRPKTKKPSGPRTVEDLIFGLSMFAGPALNRVLVTFRDFRNAEAFRDDLVRIVRDRPALINLRHSGRCWVLTAILPGTRRLAMAVDSLRDDYLRRHRDEALPGRTTDIRDVRDQRQRRQFSRMLVLFFQHVRRGTLRAYGGLDAWCQLHREGLLARFKGIGILPGGKRGRPRVHTSDAEKHRAWRDRQRGKPARRYVRKAASQFETIFVNGPAPDLRKQPQTEFATKSIGRVFSVSRDRERKPSKDGPRFARCDDLRIEILETTKPSLREQLQSDGFTLEEIAAHFARKART